MRVRGRGSSGLAVMAGGIESWNWNRSTGKMAVLTVPRSLLEVMKCVDSGSDFYGPFVRVFAGAVVKDVWEWSTRKAECA